MTWLAPSVWDMTSLYLAVGSRSCKGKWRHSFPLVKLHSVISLKDRLLNHTPVYSSRIDHVILYFKTRDLTLRLLKTCQWNVSWVRQIQFRTHNCFRGCTLILSFHERLSLRSDLFFYQQMMSVIRKSYIKYKKK